MMHAECMLPVWLSDSVRVLDDPCWPHVQLSCSCHRYATSALTEQKLVWLIESTTQQFPVNTVSLCDDTACLLLVVYHYWSFCLCHACSWEAVETHNWHIPCNSQSRLEARNFEAAQHIGRRIADVLSTINALKDGTKLGIFMKSGESGEISKMQKVNKPMKGVWHLPSVNKWTVGHWAATSDNDSR